MLANTKQSIPLLLVPGLLCNEALFEPIYKELPAWVVPRYMRLNNSNSTSELAKHILRDAPAKFILAGLSMGGILAFEIYRQAPERVTGLILMDTNAASEKIAATEKRNALVDKAQAGDFSSITPTILMPYLIHPSRLHDIALTSAITAMADDIGVEHFAAHAQALATRLDSISLLTSINVPTLIITGSHDALCPRQNHLTMAEHINTVSMHVIPECGHLSTMEQPQLVGQHIRDWLNYHYDTITTL